RRSGDRGDGPAGRRAIGVQRRRRRQPRRPGRAALLRAPGRAGRRVRFRGPVVAVTGSNGKTTTKELCAAALRPLGEVLRTPGNFNTDVGLPLTILSASGGEAAWVLEMAMRAPG